ncbi:hypothetical protein CASFOL_018897 [Castilleja foliolosa]|uniref:Uncharacterized protein n=1 Tax=Castilleja foliolosa TaxID=1961234 RepID=A0ABD3D2U6_9LAMI
MMMNETRTIVQINFTGIFNFELPIFLLLIFGSLLLMIMNLRLLSNGFNPLRSLPSMVVGWSNDDVQQLDATTQFQSPPIKEVIKSGVVSRFIEILGRDDSPPLEFEATWVLTIIASGASGYTEVVIDHGVIPTFVRILGSPSDAVREQETLLVARPKSRDLVLTLGALMPLLAQFNDHANWFVKQALAAVARLIHTNDGSVLTNACWALAYLSDGTNDKIQSVIDAGVCPHLVELLLSYMAVHFDSGLHSW